MILDESAAKSMAQQAADLSNTEQSVYQRGNGGFLVCAKGNVAGLQMALKPNEQINYLYSVKPSHWPKDVST